MHSECSLATPPPIPSFCGLTSGTAAHEDALRRFNTPRLWPDEADAQIFSGIVLSVVFRQRATLQLPEVYVRVPERALPQKPPGRNQSLLYVAALSVLRRFQGAVGCLPPELHQVLGRRLQDGELRKFTAHHSNLIAIVKAGAAVAVLV